MKEDQMNITGKFKYGIGQNIHHRTNAENISTIKARVYDVDKQEWCYVLQTGAVVSASTIHSITKAVC